LFANEEKCKAFASKEKGRTRALLSEALFTQSGGAEQKKLELTFL
jgi:hypothetical protein